MKMNNLKYKKNIQTKILSEFLLGLNKNTLKDFTYFGKIDSITINNIVQNEIKRNDKIKYFVFLNDEMIGYGFLTKFEKFSKQHNCILGIVIADLWQNKGYGKKICQHMINSAWKGNFNKIWLTVYEENKIAIKMYKSLGFEIEGVFINDEIVDMKEKNVVSMAIFKDKNFNSKKRKKIMGIS